VNEPARVERTDIVTAPWLRRADTTKPPAV
jgi:hypothetical protein